jgi:hypothetical protein
LILSGAGHPIALKWDVWHDLLPARRNAIIQTLLGA